MMKKESYWERFLDITDYLPASQIKWLTSISEPVHRFLPFEVIGQEEIPYFGIAGIVKYDFEYYPLNWNRQIREISVNEHQKCIHSSWTDDGGRIRCLSIILPNDWKITNRYPDLAVYSVYKNNTRIQFAKSQLDAISPEDAFKILKSSAPAVLERPTVVLNTFSNYYTKVMADVFLFNSRRITNDGSVWTLQVDGKSVSRPKWDKYIFSIADYVNDVWNISNVSKKESLNLDLMCLKYQRSYHPKLPIRRTVAYFASTMNQKRILSPVLIQYIFYGDSISDEDFKSRKMSDVEADWNSQPSESFVSYNDDSMDNFWEAVQSQSIASSLSQYQSTIEMEVEVEAEGNSHQEQLSKSFDTKVFRGTKSPEVTIFFTGAINLFECKLNDFPDAAYRFEMDVSKYLPQQSQQSQPRPGIYTIVLKLEKVFVSGIPPEGCQFNVAVGCAGTRDVGTLADFANFLNDLLPQCLLNQAMCHTSNDEGFEINPLPIDWVRYKKKCIPFSRPVSFRAKIEIRFLDYLRPWECSKGFEPSHNNCSKVVRVHHLFLNDDLDNLLKNYWDLVPNGAGWYYVSIQAYECHIPEIGRGRDDYILEISDNDTYDIEEFVGFLGEMLKKATTMGSQLDEGEEDLVNLQLPLRWWPTGPKKFHTPLGMPDKADIN